MVRVRSESAGCCLERDLPSCKEENMTVWKCNKCGNTVDAVTPPETCPTCKEKCEFIDVTCYIPECGGPDSGNVNPQVFQESYKSDK
jgi:rubredoxin